MVPVVLWHSMTSGARNSAFEGLLRRFVMLVKPDAQVSRKADAQGSGVEDRAVTRDHTAFSSSWTRRSQADGESPT